MALLKLQTLPQDPAVLYAAWLAKAESQKIPNTPSTAAIALGSANFLVRGHRGAMQRYTQAGIVKKH